MPRSSPRAASPRRGRRAHLEAAARVLPLATLIACQALPAEAGRREGVEAVAVPDAEATTPPYVVRGDAVELQAMGLSVRVRPLSEDERDAYFTLRTRLGKDPFPKRDAYPKGFTVFEISFSNDSGTTMSFSPALSACRLDRDLELLPFHVDQVLDVLRAAWIEHPDGERLAMRSLDDFHVSRLVLKNGERATRLMVYEGYPPKAKQLILELGPLMVGTRTLQPTMRFDLHFPKH